MVSQCEHQAVEGRGGRGVPVNADCLRSCPEFSGVALSSLNTLAQFCRELFMKDRKAAVLLYARAAWRVQRSRLHSL